MFQWNLLFAEVLICSHFIRKMGFWLSKWNETHQRMRLVHSRHSRTHKFAFKIVYRGKRGNGKGRGFNRIY